MSSLELISEVKGDYAHWRDARGQHWLELIDGEGQTAVHRVNAGEVAEDPGWAAATIASLRASDEVVGSELHADQLRRLKLPAVGDQELELLRACGAGRAGAEAVYADWLRGQGRDAEARYLDHPFLHWEGPVSRMWSRVGQHRCWRWADTGCRPPLSESEPAANLKRSWVRDRGVPVGLLLESGDGGSIGEELDLLPSLVRLELDCTGSTHLSAMPVPLDRITQVTGLRALTLRAAAGGLPDLSPLAALPRLRELRLFGLEDVESAILPLLSLLPDGQLDSLVAPGWRPSPEGCDELRRQAVHHLAVDVSTQAQVDELPLTALYLTSSLDRFRGELPSTLRVLGAQLTGPPGAVKLTALEQLESLALDIDPSSRLGHLQLPSSVRRLALSEEIDGRAVLVGPGVETLSCIGRRDGRVLLEGVGLSGVRRLLLHRSWRERGEPIDLGWLPRTLGSLSFVAEDVSADDVAAMSDLPALRDVAVAMAYVPPVIAELPHLRGLRVALRRDACPDWVTDAARRRPELALAACYRPPWDLTGGLQALVGNSEGEWRVF